MSLKTPTRIQWCCRSPNSGHVVSLRALEPLSFSLSSPLPSPSLAPISFSASQAARTVSQRGEREDRGCIDYSRAQVTRFVSPHLFLYARRRSRLVFGGGIPLSLSLSLLPSLSLFLPLARPSRPVPPFPRFPLQGRQVPGGDSARSWSEELPRAPEVDIHAPRYWRPRRGPASYRPRARTRGAARRGPIPSACIDGEIGSSHSRHPTRLRPFVRAAARSPSLLPFLLRCASPRHPATPHEPLPATVKRSPSQARSGLD